MAQPLLDLKQTHTGLQQVRGVGMPQRMDADLLGDARFQIGLAEGLLNRGERRRPLALLRLPCATPRLAR